jgi:hypothetical protein
MRAYDGRGIPASASGRSRDSISVGQSSVLADVFVANFAMSAFVAQNAPFGHDGMRIDIGSGGLAPTAPASSPSVAAMGVAVGADEAEGAADVAVMPAEPDPGGTFTVVELVGSSLAHAAIGTAKGT